MTGGRLFVVGRWRFTIERTPSSTASAAYGNCTHRAVIDTSYGARKSSRCECGGFVRQDERRLRWWQFVLRWEERQRQTAIAAFLDETFSA